MPNWWGGSSADADKQTSERNSRAARRTIAEQLENLQSPASGDDEVYEDCDTSGLFGGVDGGDDADLDDMAAAAAAELARQKRLPVEDADYENDDDSWKKEVKIKFDKHDVNYWFNSVESQMRKFGINRQWDKKDSIIPLLPEEIVDELKPLLRLTQAEAGENIYKDVKTEIVALYGPREEDAFKKAIALKITDKPSAFGKKLIHIICPGSKPFASCHCARMVYGF